MIIRKTLLLSMFGLYAFPLWCAIPLAEQFKQAGYAELCDEHHDSTTFDSLYSYFDTMIEFLHANPSWVHKLYNAKERFIRSKERQYYSTDFFGFYDDTQKLNKSQIAFYYSVHFHDFLCTHFPEFRQITAIMQFLDACREVQQPYGSVFDNIATELGLAKIFCSEYGHPPILSKVIKYSPSYAPTKPHYDGTAFSLFLDSTDNQSLLIAAYKPTLRVDDFLSPTKNFLRSDNRHSFLLIPGTLLTEFEIYPTPHIVVHSGKTRYATIAFAMRPSYTPQKNQFSLLPNFKR